MGGERTKEKSGYSEMRRRQGGEGTEKATRTREGTRKKDRTRLKEANVKYLGKKPLYYIHFSHFSLKNEE